MKKFHLIAGVFILVLIGSTFLLVQNTHAYEIPACSGPAGGENNRNFATINPMSGIVGTVVEIDACGCGLDGQINDYYLLPAGCSIIDPTMPPACAIPGVDIDYPVCNFGLLTRPHDHIYFDLSGANVGEYDIQLWYRVWSPKGLGAWSNIIWNKKYNVFSPSVIGWGWFGASTGTSTLASPGWMSLSCQNTYDDAPDGTCYDPVDNPNGTDYGLEMYYNAGLSKYEILGSAWLGEYEDSTPNPADDAPTGWVTFDPPGYPFIPPTWPQLPGTHLGTTYNGPAVFDPATGQVDGWARSNTLQSYGEELSCTNVTRTWPLVGDHVLISDDNATNVRIAQSSDGVYHAVWEYNAAIRQIHYSQKVSGSWTVPIPLSVLYPNTGSPDITIDGANTIHVSYTANNNDEIIYTNCEYGTDCTDPNEWATYDVAHVPPDAIEFKHNQTIAAAGDYIYIAFQGEIAGDMDVYLYESDDKGTSWASPTKISVNSGGHAYDPQIARDFGNNVHIIWLDGRVDDTKRQVYYRYQPDGGAMADEEYLSANLSGFNINNPALTVGPDDIPHVVFDSDNRIYYIRSSSTGGWQELQSLEAGSFFDPTITVSNDYTIHVLYQDGVGIGNAIKHKESPDGSAGSWTDPSIIAARRPADTVTKPYALADRYSGVVDLVYRRNSTADIYQNTSTELFGQNCNQWGDPQVTQTWGLDWGWMSLRGGNVEVEDVGSATPYYGPMGSCYDCDETAKTCMICEVDYEYYQTSGNSPDIYACNVCSGCSVCDNDTDRFCVNNNHMIDCAGGATACVLKKVCRRTGDDCTAPGSTCPSLLGAVNECTYACSQCNECNLWGLSIEGPMSTVGRFHGSAWSAGGTVPVSPSYPAGTYDSGLIEIENNIPDGYDCGQPDCECNTSPMCAGWGWERVDPQNGNVICSNDDQLSAVYLGLEVMDISGFGTCKVQGSAPAGQYFSKTVPITSAGNYFVSLISINTDDPLGENIKLSVLDADNKDLYELNMIDHYSPNPAEVVSCTFPTQVYLEPTYKFQFENTSDLRTELDAIRITTLPVYQNDCSDLNPGVVLLDEVYVDEVGLGFSDFSSVSLITPWLQTRYGDVFARLNIGPGGSATCSDCYNSDYLIETSPDGTIQGWKVPEVRYNREGLGSQIFLPDPGAGYKNVLGRIDYPGIISTSGNEYSDRVVEINSDTFHCAGGNENWSNIKDLIFDVIGDNWLKNGIYHIGKEDEYCSLTINAPIVFESGPDKISDNGSGLFVIEGDLIIENDITYDDPGFGAIQVASQIASAGWIVKGDIIIDGAVENVAGTYAALGCEVGGNCPGAGHDGVFRSGNTGNSLRLEGLVLAKGYVLERTYAGSDKGSEIFDNTGRLQANPPPGMVDISLNTPVISTVRPTF